MKKYAEFNLKELQWSPGSASFIKNSIYLQEILL